MSKADTKGRLPAHHPLIATAGSKKSGSRSTSRWRATILPLVCALTLVAWYWVPIPSNVKTIGIPSFLLPSPVSVPCGGDLNLKHDENNDNDYYDDDDDINDDDDDDEGLQLRHIFHHGAGPKNYKLHRRLDITPEYIRLRDFLALMADIAVAHEAQINTASKPATEADAEGKTLDNLLEDVVDWPRAHAGKNPFTVKLPVKFKLGKAQRLKDRHVPGFVEGYLDYAIKVKGNPKILGSIGLEWDDIEDIPVPDMKDKDTLVSMASISSNAYVRFPKDDKEKLKSDWTDVGQGWQPDTDDENINFGWLEDGLRGHIFVSNKSNTVVIGIKGTLGAGLPGGGSDETATNDKINDNLLFSCCCARVGYMWTTVCDCYEKTYTCNQDCLERELLRQDRYYQAVMDLYHNVTLLYSPDKYNIWVTGHSLGGALASLLGRTFGLPTVAFEAPGELLATKRLHLPQAPGIPKHLENIWHVGNTADPIYMGVCNGATSSCNAAGYAMETQCHTGRQCVYDVVADKGWSVNLLNHRIHTVIDDIIMKYNDTAPCVEALPCRDCFNWRYVTHDDFDGDEPELPNPLRSLSLSSILSLSSTAPETELTQGKPVSSTTRQDDNRDKVTLTALRTTSVTLSASKTSTSTSTPSDKPQKCLERTWYGWCTKWGYDDDDDDDNGDDGDKKKHA